MENPFDVLKGLKLGQDKKENRTDETSAIDVPEAEKSIVPKPKQELMNMFGLTRQLFEFADKNGIDHVANDRYLDLNAEYSDNPYAKELPQRFYPLVSEYPGKYYVVSYENRSGSYYIQSTRFKMVRLSTVKRRSESDEKIREIVFQKQEPSGGFGNVVFLTVRDSVMEKSFQTINTAPEGETDSPNGYAQLKYKIDSVGKKELVESDFDRMDEGIFEWQGVMVPVRWLRHLAIEQNQTEGSRMEYKDLYIIRNHENEKSYLDPRIDVRINAKGDIDNPQSLTVSIGSPVGKFSELLFEDRESGVRVELYDVPNTKKEEVFETLKNDPNYSFLFEGEITKEKIVHILKQKADMMTHDWDKKASVFSENTLEEGQQTIE